jgi:hypothetical protein
MNFRTTAATLVLATLASIASAQGVWPDDPWTDLRVVSVTSSFQNGRTVILDGDVLYSFGARFRAPGDNDSDGFLQIYDRATLGWARRPRMVNPGQFASRNFGLAADERNGLVAVGAPNDQLSKVEGEQFPAPTYYGYVRLMRLAPDGMSWSPEQLLVNLDVPGPEQPFFGGAVRFLADDLLAVGSPREDINGVNAAGAVHIYRFDGAEWVHHQRLTVDPAEGPVFGWRMGFASGDLLVAAAGGSSFNTAVYVFRENAQGEWAQAQRIPWTDADTGVNFDTDDDLMVLGAPRAKTPLGHTGEARVYRRINGVWTHEATILPEATDFDPRGSSFGNNVAVHQGSVAVATFVSPGVVQVFEPVDGEWTFAAQVRPSNTGINFARALDFDDQRVAIGDQNADIFAGGFGGESGGVFLWTRDSECFRDLRGDANNDGVTNFADLNLVLSQFGQEGDDLEGDLNNDSVVNMIDLNVVLALFGSPCLPPN